MIVENIKSAANNILERVRNPFGGALMIAWVVYNWKLVYTVFNFDSDCKLNDKLVLIETYISAAHKWTLLWGPIIAAFVTIISFLTLSHIALFAVTFFSKWVKPAVYYIVDRNQITDKKSHDSLKESFIELQTEYDDAKDMYSKNRAVHEKMGSENASLKVDLLTVKKENDILTKQNQTHVDQAHKKDVKIITLEKQISQYQTNSSSGSVLSTLERVRAQSGISQIFKKGSKWKNTFTHPNGNIGTEVFEVIDGNYIIDGIVKFKIESFKYDKQNKTVTFKKVNAAGENPNFLILQNEKRLVGLENSNTPIEYQEIEGILN